jgi:hypothetical protein
VTARSFWRIRRGEIAAQLSAIVVVTWGWTAVVMLVPGMRSMAGPVKGGDFLQFFILGTLAGRGEFGSLYDVEILHRVQLAVLPDSTTDFYLTPYPPHAGLLFAPLSQLSYLSALAIWAVFICLAYGLAVWSAWRRCAWLPREPFLVILAAVAFLPFWQLLMHGQVTVVPMLAFAAAWLALERDRRFLAGACLGLIALKPQLALAVAVVVLARREWAMLAGGATTVAAHVLGVAAIMGFGVWGDYLDFVRRVPSVIHMLQPKPYQMHSLRGFFDLLLPRWAVEVSWLLTSALVLAALVRVWRPGVSLNLRIAMLIIATALVSPHLFVYDCALLAPALLVACDWALSRPVGEVHRRLVLAGIYFLFAAYLVPIARIVPVQPSVPLLLLVFAALFLPAAKGPSEGAYPPPPLPA